VDVSGSDLDLTKGGGAAGRRGLRLGSAVYLIGWRAICCINISDFFHYDNFTNSKGLTICDLQSQSHNLTEGFLLFLSIFPETPFQSQITHNQQRQPLFHLS